MATDFRLGCLTWGREFVSGGLGAGGVFISNISKQEGCEKMSEV